MSFWVGGGFWWVVGIALGLWAFEAHRKWLDLLAERGLLPEGGTSLLTTGWFRPRSMFRSLWAVTKVSYPRAYRSDDPALEKWRTRRARRRTLFIAWMFGGLLVAIAVMIIVDLGQEQVAWALLLIPIAAGFMFTARKAYRYGNFEPPD